MTARVQAAVSDVRLERSNRVRAATTKTACVPVMLYYSLKQTYCTTPVEVTSTVGYSKINLKIHTGSPPLPSFPPLPAPSLLPLPLPSPPSPLPSYIPLSLEVGPLKSS